MMIFSKFQIVSKRHLSFQRSLFILVSILTLFSFICINHPASFAQQQDYQIGPQDTLNIEVWDHPDLTREVTISLSGAFTFPLIGEIQAADRSADSIRKEIVRRLADGYLINPQVTVTITAYRSKQVNVLGEVKNPGTFPYTRQTSLIEMISMAGGLTEEAGPEAFVLRSQESNPGNGSGAARRRQTDVDQDNVIQKVDLNNLLQTGQDLYFLLKENDTIYIPRAEFFYVLGEVSKPGQYKLEKDTTVLKAISTAGGHTKKANLKKISIVRVLAGEERELHARLSDPIQADDIIKVPESFF